MQEGSNKKREPGTRLFEGEQELDSIPFEVEGIMISPTAIGSGEVKSDGTPDPGPSRKRGVINGILEAKSECRENVELGSQIIQKIADKAIKLGIFSREELAAELRKIGVSVSERK